MVAYILIPVQETQGPGLEGSSSDFTAFFAAKNF